MPTLRTPRGVWAAEFELANRYGTSYVTHVRLDCTFPVETFPQIVAWSQGGLFMPAQTPRVFLHVLLCCVAVMSLIGCHHALVYNKNLAQPPETDPSVYTLDEYKADKKAYDAATDVGVVKLKRNQIVWGLMTDIEIVYNSNYRKLFSNKGLTSVVGDGLTLGLGAAGSIATHAATKTIFSALNTGFTGLNLSISKNYYAEQSFQVIGIAMQTRRDKIRAGIAAGLDQDAATYPLNRAKRDFNVVHAGWHSGGRSSGTTRGSWSSNSCGQGSYTGKRPWCSYFAVREPWYSSKCPDVVSG
jgi:hypothetical protein